MSLKYSVQYGLLAGLCGLKAIHLLKAIHKGKSMYAVLDKSSNLGAIAQYHRLLINFFYHSGFAA